jgi:hypothetical protein
MKAPSLFFRSLAYLGRWLKWVPRFSSLDPLQHRLQIRGNRLLKHVCQMALSLRAMIHS